MEWPKTPTFCLLFRVMTLFQLVDVKKRALMIAIIINVDLMQNTFWRESYINHKSRIIFFCPDRNLLDAFSHLHDIASINYTSVKENKIDGSSSRMFTDKKKFNFKVIQISKSNFVKFQKSFHLLLLRGHIVRFCYWAKRICNKLQIFSQK